MSNSIDAAGGAQGVGSLNLSASGTSVQLIFAQLQMELAKSNKEAALNKIDTIRQQQEQSRAITEAINALRNIKTQMGDDDEFDLDKLGKLDVTDPEGEIEKTEGFIKQANELKAQAVLGEKGSDYKADATNTEKIEKAGSVEAYDKALAQAEANKQAQKKLDSGKTPEAESSLMTVEMEKYFKDQGIDYNGGGMSRRQNEGEWNRAITNLENRAAMISVKTICDKYDVEMPTSGDLTKERIDTMIASLEAVQEDLGSDIQQIMVFVQDYMGQYNSYTQGASSAVSDANETLKTIARG